LSNVVDVVLVLVRLVVVAGVVVVGDVAETVPVAAFICGSAAL